MGCIKVLPEETTAGLVRNQACVEERHERLLRRISKTRGVRKILPE
jgi:hypothetical protein